MCVKKYSLNKALYLYLFTKCSGFFRYIRWVKKKHTHTFGCFSVATIFVLYPLPYLACVLFTLEYCSYFPLLLPKKNNNFFFQQVTNINLGSYARHSNVMIKERNKTESVERVTQMCMSCKCNTIIELYGIRTNTANISHIIMWSGRWIYGRSTFFNFHFDLP